MTAPQSPQQIAVIDQTVQDYQTLIEGAQAQGLEVILITAEGDGFEQLAEKLTGRSEIEALHILSHGADGQVFLGGEVLNADTLTDYSDALEAIKQSLSEDGDILLYGCNIAATETGVEFIGKLAQATQADIAASDDLTGASDKGGDWILEQSTGNIESTSIASISFSNVLASQFTQVSDPLAAAGAQTAYSGSRMFIDIDYDSDGDRDFIAYDGSAYKLYINDGSGGFTQTNPNVPFNLINATDYLVADFDNDGDEDVMTADTGANTSTYYRNDGGSFTTVADPLAAAGAQTAYSGNRMFIDIDYDSDGDRDFIAYDGSAYKLYINDGSGGFTQTNPNVPFNLINATDYLVADFDNDGDEDVMTADTGANTSTYYRNDGGSFTTVADPLAAAGAQTAYSGSRMFIDIDYDSDGDRDFIAYDGSAYKLYINDGSGGFTQTNPNVPFNLINATDYLVADFDNDGDEDVMTADTGANTSTYYRQDGTVGGTDNKPPVISSSTPTDNSTGIDPTANISLTFDEVISSTGTGTIKIYKASDNSLVESIPGNDGRVTGSGTSTITINPASDLTASTEYYILIEKQAFFDADGMTFMGIDDKTALSFTTGSSNATPTIGGTPTDITVTEDTASNVDLSSVTLDDADGDNLTVTLTLDSGTFSQPADGSGVGSGVTETLNSGSGSNIITLAGSAADINTYLDTISNIQYTGASNNSGDNAATLSIKANDGIIDSATSTVNLDITDVTSATSTAAAFNTSDGSNLTPYITTDSSDETIIIGTAGHELGSIADGQGGTDTLSVVTGVDLSSMSTLQHFENLTLANDAIVTIAASQLAQFTGTITASGAEAITVMGDGNFSTLANIENFVAGDDSSNSRTITVTQTNTNVTATSSSDAVTFNIGTLNYTGTLTGEATANDTLQMGNGSSVAGATLSHIENLTVDSDASVTMTAAQHNNFSTITATGNELITISASLTNITGNAAIETYVLNQDTTFTLGSTTQDVTGSIGNDTVIVGSFTTVGDLNGADNTDRLWLKDGANVSGATLSNFEMLQLDNNASVTIAPSQLAQFTAGIIAAGTETINIRGDNDFTTLANIENFVVGDDDSDFSRTITVAQSNTNVTTISWTDAVTFDIGNLNYSGTLTGEGSVNDTLQMGNGSSVSGATLLNIENLTLVTGASVTMTESQNNAFSGTVTAAGTNQITISDSTGGVNAHSGVENYVLNAANTITLSDSGHAVTGSTGNDTMVVGAGTDSLTGGTGADTFKGSASNLNGDTIADLEIGDKLLITDITGLSTANVRFNGNSLLQVDTDATDFSFSEIAMTLSNGAGANLAFTVEDSGSDTLITFQALNDAPVFANLDGGATFIEDDSAVVIDSDVSVSDTELDALNGANGDYDGASITIARNGGANAEDVFSHNGLLGALTQGHDFTFNSVTVGTVTTNSSGTLVLTFNNHATSAIMDSVLQNIAYSNTSDTPPATVTLDYTFNDGTSNSTGTNQATVTITPTNDAPTVNLNGVTDVTVIEDTASDVDLSSVEFADAEGNNITVTLTASAGSFSNPVDGASTGSGVIETLVDAQTITLEGTAADINTYLGTASNIQYTGDLNVFGDDSATLTISAVDAIGAALSPNPTVNIDITAVNDAPTIETNSGPNVQTNNTVTITNTHLNEGDPDDDGAELTYTLDTLPTSGTLLLNNVALTQGQTFTQADIDNDLLTFEAAGSTGAATFGITLADGGEDGVGTASDTVTINVTAPPPPTPEPTEAPTPEPTEPPTEAPTNMIDGVTVEQSEVTENGQTVNKIIVSPVPSDRQDTDDSSELADIPLHFDADNNPVTTLRIPEGIGVTARSNETAQDQTSFRDALYLLRDSAPESDWFSMINGLDQWLNGVGAGWLNQVTFSSSSDEAPSQPIKVSGTEGNDKTEVMVIDASQLPAGTVIDLDNIEFAIIVGDVEVRGGEGSNIVFAGGGGQNIVLGAEDDELHTGNGNDTVGSRGGDDQLYGDAGDDILFGGTGNDLIDGGVGTDIAVFAYDYAEYNITQLENTEDGMPQWQISHATEGTDTLVNIEYLEFADVMITLTGESHVNDFATSGLLFF